MYHTNSLRSQPIMIAAGSELLDSKRGRVCCGWCFHQSTGQLQESLQSTVYNASVHFVLKQLHSPVSPTPVLINFRSWLSMRVQRALFHQCTVVLRKSDTKGCQVQTVRKRTGTLTTRLQLNARHIAAASGLVDKFHSS